MAARRLLAVMLVFLAISTVLAVLAPPPVEEESTTSTTSKREAVSAQPRAEGRLLRRRIEVRGKGGATVARPARIEVRVGDQLALLVSVPRTMTLELGATGSVETAVPGAPARFDVFTSRPGSSKLIELERGKLLATIVARPLERARSKASAGDRSRTSTATNRRSRR